MANLDKKLVNRSLRAARVRAKVSGTAERPRLTVTISNMHVSAQLIDDVKQHTIAAATTVGTKQTGTMTEQAALIGAEVAKKAKKGISAGQEKFLQDCRCLLNDAASVLDKLAK